MLLKWKNLPWNFHIGVSPSVTTSNIMWSPSFRQYASRNSSHPPLIHTLVPKGRKIKFHDLWHSSLIIKSHFLLMRPFLRAISFGRHWKGISPFAHISRTVLMLHIFTIINSKRKRKEEKDMHDHLSLKFLKDVHEMGF